MLTAEVLFIVGLFSELVAADGTGAA